MKRFEGLRGQLGGQLGIGLCVVGFLLVFLGWNGAASNDSVVEQFPYLLSGGVAGLTLVVIGVGMLVVQNQRADRVALQASLDAVREALERSGAPAASAGVASGTEGLVVVGRSSFHRPTCHLVDGRDDATVLTTAEATARGLEPCRLCSPPALGSGSGAPDEGGATEGSGDHAPSDGDDGAGEPAPKPDPAPRRRSRQIRAR